MDNATTHVTPDNTDPMTAEVDRVSESDPLKPYAATARVKTIKDHDNRIKGRLRKKARILRLGNVLVAFRRYVEACRALVSTFTLWRHTWCRPTTMLPMAKSDEATLAAMDREVIPGSASKAILAERVTVASRFESDYKSESDAYEARLAQGQKKAKRPWIGVEYTLGGRSFGVHAGSRPAP